MKEYSLQVIGTICDGPHLLLDPITLTAKAPQTARSALWQRRLAGQGGSPLQLESGALV
jgi:hypothetical protein